MPFVRSSPRCRIAASLLLAGTTALPAAAFAAEPPAPADAGADAATLNSLVKQLIEQNVITVQRGAEILASHEEQAKLLGAVTRETAAVRPSLPPLSELRPPAYDPRRAAEVRAEGAGATRATGSAVAATGSPAAQGTAAVTPQTGGLVVITNTPGSGTAAEAQQAAVAKAIADTKKEMVAEAVTLAKAQILAQLNGELPPATTPGTVRVQHVPEVVRDQIKTELRNEVLAQAKAEHWAAPGDASPDWVRRIKLVGDLRVRSQSNFFSQNNSNQIPDFARVNQIGPIPILDRGYFIPLLNTTVDRLNRLEVRARIGVEAHVNDWFDAGIVLATGNDNSPISTNQNLGGGLAKRDVWLDQAWINLHPVEWAHLDLGRFKNPFLSTELMFDEDLRFDGAAAAVEAGKFIHDDLTLSLRGGAFPLDYGDPNFPQNDVTKLKAPERWLLSGQIALGAQWDDTTSFRVAAAYHRFTRQRANLSDPCFLYRVQAEYRSGVICSTDNERALFLRKGNTVAPIRNIVLDVPAPAVNETRVSPQYVGLAFNYHILDVNAEAKFKLFDNLSLTLGGNYVRNLAFKRNQLCRYSAAISEAFPPLNNVKPLEQGDTGDGNVCSRTNPSAFVGGNQGYMGTLTFGHDKLFLRGHWQAKVGYRYLQSDAVLDAYTDSDFHLGGTNTKGYTVSGKYSPFDNVTIGGRWMSANQITGEPLAIDVLQADLEIAF